MRMISVNLQLDSGHKHEIKLKEDAEELTQLFHILAARGADPKEVNEIFMQLPLAQSNASCSFNTQQLVSITTQPAVYFKPEQNALIQETAVAPASIIVNSPRHMIIDNFLGEDEHQQLLAYAQSSEQEFDKGTVEGEEIPQRQNKVIMNFAESMYSRILSNRLLTYLPLFTRELALTIFPVAHVESQLTASAHGQYYQRHCDVGPGDAENRTISCVYYFFKQPRPFSGGALRLYDSIYQGEHHKPSENFREVEAITNRLVIFPSAAYHEVMPVRCPSRKFNDSRFAVTSWIHASPDQNPENTHGWGHLHCGIVPPQFNTDGENE